MKKREANFSITLRHWIRANPLKFSCHLEVKQTTTNSIPFSCLENHQAVYGEAVQNSSRGVLTRIQGSTGEADYIYSYRDPVFIVVKYPDCFCIIPLVAFLAEKEVSKRKSLTSARAREIAQETVELGGSHGRKGTQG